VATVAAFEAIVWRIVSIPALWALANIREAEVRAAASALGVREVSILDYHGQQLDRANPREAVATIAGHNDALNRELVDRLQRGGRTFISNAVVGGHYVLRACIVNFHTTQTNVDGYG
jgi:hypothetical protein